MNKEFEFIHRRQLDWHKSNFADHIEQITVNFTNRSATLPPQMQFYHISAKDIIEYISILQSPFTKSIIFLICGIDGWSTNIEGVKKFWGKYKSIQFQLVFFESKNRLNGHKRDDWSLYLVENDVSIERYVSKIYDLDRLIEIADGDCIEERYTRLLEAWEKCSKGRGLLSMASRQRLELMGTTPGNSSNFGHFNISWAFNTIMLSPSDCESLELSEFWCHGRQSSATKYALHVRSIVWGIFWILDLGSRIWGFAYSGFYTMEMDLDYDGYRICASQQP